MSKKPGELTPGSKLNKLKNQPMKVYPVKTTLQLSTKISNLNLLIIII